MRPFFSLRLVTRYSTSSQKPFVFLSYGSLHQKFWTPFSRQLMGQNPKELPKTHSHAPAKAIILWKTAIVKQQNSRARTQDYELISINSPLTSRTFGADLRTVGYVCSRAAFDSKQSHWKFISIDLSWISKEIEKGSISRCK